MDWKEVIRTVAPTLAGLFGTPLMGGAVKILADSLLGGSSGDQATDEVALQKALSGGLTPELQVKLLDSENQVKLAVIQADVRKAELTVEADKNVMGDIADARAHNANTVGILYLGYLINAASYLCVIMTLIGAFLLLKGEGLKAVDPNVLASISLLLGGVMQWVLANAAQANGFFFGSSPASRAATVKLSDGATNTLTSIKK